MKALDELGVALDDAHRIDGLRMIANRTVRQLDWPGIAPFPAHGAVWPRRRLDARLMELAEKAGAEILWEHDALPVIDDRGRVTGVSANGGTWAAGHGRGRRRRPRRRGPDAGRRA